MLQEHYAQYGNVMLRRIVCPECKEFAFIIKNKMRCCDLDIDEFNARKIKLMTSSEPRRRLPNALARDIILNIQKNTCFYCGEKFGTLFWNNSKNCPVYLKIHWDHLEPYSFSYNNLSENFVASCNICNGIKSNLMFKNLKELKGYVRRKRAAKKYYEKVL